MKKRTLRCCLLVAALPSLLQAQEAVSDSLHNHLQEVEITATRATELTPVAHTNIGKEQLSKMNTGVDFPYLVATTPSVVTTSDAGAGIGYTSLRIRGTDGTRINVTANGIPVNDNTMGEVYEMCQNLDMDFAKYFGEYVPEASEGFKSPETFK